MFDTEIHSAFWNIKLNHWIYRLYVNQCKSRLSRILCDTMIQYELHFSVPAAVPPRGLMANEAAQDEELAKSLNIHSATKVVHSGIVFWEIIYSGCCS